MAWLQLANRTAIVTGAASGIGRAVAQTLREAGCRLVLADRNIVALNKEFAAESTTSVGTGGAAVTTVECDVSIRQQVDALMDAAVVAESDDFAAASILVNCAGVTADGRVESLSESDWNRVVDVNLKGTFYTCQSFLQRRTRLVLCTEPASIVNVGSVVSEQGNIGQVNYAASKGGVVGLTRALAKEVARRSVRVNAVLPGFIETPMSQSVPENIMSIIVKKIALQRLGRPEEVANVIAFLASDRSQYITGEIIECSGMISL